MSERLQHLIEESDEIEADPDVVRNPDSKPHRTSRARVLQVRLTEQEYANLALEAEAEGVPVSAFARRRLAATNVDVDRVKAVARIRTELDKLLA